jgi:hypothetical protein
VNITVFHTDFEKKKKLSTVNSGSSVLTVIHACTNFLYIYGPERTPCILYFLILMNIRTSDTQKK